MNSEAKYEEEFDRLWKLLVPQSDEAPSIQGELVRAIGRLSREWLQNGNNNWSFSGSSMFEDWVSFINYHLVLSPEEQYKPQYCARPFDEATTEQITEDLEFIKLLGMQGIKPLDAIYLSEQEWEEYFEAQQYEILERASPLELNDAAKAVFQRIKKNIVEFCLANPELKWRYGKEPTEDTIMSIF